MYGINAAAQYLPSGNNSNTSSIPSVHGGYKQNNKSLANSQFATSTPTFNNNRINGLEDNTLMPINGVRKAPEGQDNESFIHEDMVDSKELIVNTSHVGLPTDSSSATHYTTDNNGKINVHVTVMINAGTYVCFNSKCREEFLKHWTMPAKGRILFSNRKAIYSKLILCQ